MRDPVLRRLVDTLGWIAYLHVIGDVGYRRELLKIAPEAAAKAKRRQPRRPAPEAAKVLRLEDYRARRRARRTAGRRSPAEAGAQKVA